MNTFLLFNSLYSTEHLKSNIVIEFRCFNPRIYFYEEENVRCKIIKVRYVMKSRFLGVCRPLGDSMMRGLSMLLKHQGYLLKIPAASLLMQQRLMEINLRGVFFIKLKFLRIRVKNKEFSKSGFQICIQKEMLGNCIRIFGSK